MSNRTDESINCRCIDELSGGFGDQLINDLLRGPGFREVCSERMLFSDVAELIDEKFHDIWVTVVGVIE